MNEKLNFSDEKVTINAGEIYISNQPSKIRVILGSCVSILLYHKESGRAAICHAALPDISLRGANPSAYTLKSDSSAVTSNDNFRYVTGAFRHMIREMNKQGIDNDNIVAGLFGGSNVMVESRDKSVAKKNVETARELLSVYKIKIHHEDVGGGRGRTLQFNPSDGIVDIQFHG